MIRVVDYDHMDEVESGEVAVLDRGGAFRVVYRTHADGRPFVGLAGQTIVTREEAVALAQEKRDEMDLIKRGLQFELGLAERETP